MVSGTPSMNTPICLSSDPRMDGCALVARIRDRWPQVPVIAVSGYVGARDVEEFEFDGFVHKPIDLQELRGKVAGLLPQ